MTHLLGTIKSPMRGKDPESSLLYKGPESSDLKIQETHFFVIKISYYFLVSLKPTFSNQCLCFLLKLT